ncbi:MAG: 5'/3'-nucleotidase SurE [Bacilli bacterium]|nr:5'/3'-nucleotidase SurE [Bacilli bacterium]MDD4076595.1 5'/3'-nucleotidase SurE [Bacilli bacterium]MDD4387706.1 5'/3'-nucleotidase SurE [Bacilli bacterium]
MRILVTNDDSVRAEGLKVLANLAAIYGEVLVVAPFEEQSAQSHSINIKNGFRLEQFEIGLKIDTYFCDSTPADCVRAAHYALRKPFDIVLSGINNGFNLGEDITYSGTVAAAVEAAFLGKKTIAFSAAVGKTHMTKELFVRIIDYFKLHHLFDYCDIYNINIPDNPRGIKITRQGKTHFYTEFVNHKNLWYQKGYHRYYLEKEIPTDVWAINNGFISVTPLTVDRTNYTVFKKFTNLS